MNALWFSLRFFLWVICPIATLWSIAEVIR